MVLFLDVAGDPVIELDTEQVLRSGLIRADGDFNGAVMLHPDNRGFLHRFQSLHRESSELHLHRGRRGVIPRVGF